MSSCQGCIHRVWIEPSRFAISVRGYGCSLSGGHAIERCKEFDDGSSSDGEEEMGELIGI